MNRTVLFEATAKCEECGATGAYDFTGDLVCAKCAGFVEETPVESRNRAVLQEFVAYCAAHPDERFWQALRNWSGQPFILACEDIDGGDTTDTFYWEGKAPNSR